jgi:hypothetical protein
VKGEMRALGTQAKNLTAKTAAVPATVGQSAGRALKTAVNAGSEMVATSAQLGKDAANVAVGAAQDVAQGAVDLVSEAAHVAGEAVEAGKSNLAKQIKKNPVAAAVTALGVGFIAGVSGRK